MKFNSNSAKIFDLVNQEPLFNFISFLKKISLVVLTLAIFLGLASVWADIIVSPTQAFGIVLIFGAVSAGLKLGDFFFSSKIKEFPVQVSVSQAISAPENYNLARCLSFEVARAVQRCLNLIHSKRSLREEVRTIKISSTDLFYFVLAENPQLEFVFTRATLNLKGIRAALKANLGQSVGSSSVWWTSDFEKVILKSLEMAAQKGHSQIELGDIVIGLAYHNKIFREALINSELKAQDIKHLVWWEEQLKRQITSSKRFWEYTNLAKRGGVGRTWGAGYTVNLDPYSFDVIDKVRHQNFREVIGHDQQLEIVERILDRSQINNVLLVGRPGVGRNSLIEKLAKKSFLGQSLPSINYNRIVKLDISAVLARLEDMEKVESTLDKIFQEVAQAGNVILVIDEFHNYVGQRTQLGKIDISGLLSGYLHLPQFRIIGICSYAGLHKYIEQNPSLLKMLGKVEVPELPQEETIRLLEDFALRLEQKYNKAVSYPALREIVSLSARYMPGIPFPKKALDLLDEVMVYGARFVKRPVILPEDVAKVVSEKTEIPVGKIEFKEKKVLLNLEQLIHRRIINQDLAVREVSSALRRARTQVTIREGPLGGFLFLGPTGVGKTETSKVLASIYFGSESRMIRLDMSEFQNLEDIPRLIGSTEQSGQLTTPVRENPFSLVLLDELEKAHPNILNLFLQILDEGYITDGLGRKVSFQNTMIIATSNAGADIIWEDIEANKEMNLIKDDLLSYLFKQKLFNPEFINRFDAVVLFKPLTRQSLMDIAELLLSDLAKNLEKKDIQLVITEPLKQKIVELGYSPAFGAREMRRVIQDKIENPIATALLEDRVQRGDKIKVDPQEFKVEVV